MTRSLGLIFFVSWISSAFASTEHRDMAQRLFSRLAGVPLQLSDERLPRMEKLLEEGRSLEAAKIATDDEHFYRITLWHWALPMSNKAESPLVDFNDFAATVIGVALNDLPATQLLTGDFVFRGVSSDPKFPLPQEIPAHYVSIERRNLPLKETLKRFDRRHIPAGGVMLTWAFAKEVFDAGTNRAAVKLILSSMACLHAEGKPEEGIEGWSQIGLPEANDLYVRQDVNRHLTSDQDLYNFKCRKCHVPMDAMGGAFARFDFLNNRLIFYGFNDVAPKMNQKADQYKDGYVTQDDSWRNLIAEKLGSHAKLEGKGINEFGEMLAGSDRFKSCLAERTFTDVCRKKPDFRTKLILKEVADDFANEGYRLRYLFERVATLPSCLGLGLRHYDQIRASLASATGVSLADPEIETLYSQAKTRLPRSGVMSNAMAEWNGAMISAETSLASVFCRKLLGKSSPVTLDQLIEDLAKRFWQRKPTLEERQLLRGLADGASREGGALPGRDIASFLVCTSMASSFDSIVQH
jgi:hypothetical protein